MRIAIIGGAPSSGHLAPFEDESWQIWCLGNQLDKILPRRVTRVFEIHDDLTEHSPEYPKWLVDQQIPLVTGDKFPIQNDVELYNEDNARALMGGDHLTSSPAYMMAYAFYTYGSKIEEIGIYGCDMAVDDHEYFYQRPTMYGWIGYAIGRGVKITIPDESPLFKDPFIEGRGGGKPKLEILPFSEQEFRGMAERHDKRVEEIDEKVRQLQADMNAHHAAKQVYEKLSTTARAVESGQRIQTLSETARVV